MNADTKDAVLQSARLLGQEPLARRLLDQGHPLDAVRQQVVEAHIQDLPTHDQAVNRRTAPKRGAADWDEVFKRVREQNTDTRA